MSRSPSRVFEIDVELRSLYARYEHLMRERAALTQPPAQPPLSADQAGAGPSARGAGGREASPVSVQAVLLALGGLLLGVASIVFTLVAWSRLGVGGRAAVLSAVTVVTLAAPLLLLRRRLAATAETVAAVGLLLVLLDAYLLRRLDVLVIDGAVYAGAVLAVVALGWVLYGQALPGLRGVRPTALVLAQPALPLLVSRGGPLWVAGALLVVAGLDLLARPRVVALGCGGLAWSAAVLTLLPLAYASPVGVVAVLLLGAAGVLAVLGSGPLGEVGVAAGVLVAAAGLIAPLRAALDSVAGGSVLAITLVALAVAAGSFALSSGRAVAGEPPQAPAGPARWLGVRVAGGILLVPGAVSALAGAVVAVAVPGATAALPWTGVATPAEPDLPRLFVLVAVLAAAGAALVLRTWLPVLLTAAGVVALLAPVALDLPYPVTLGFLAALTLACWRVPVAAAPLAGLTVAWALATQPATILVLAGLALAAAAQAATATRRTGIVAAAVAVAALAGLGAAVPLAAGGSATAVGFTLLGLTAAAFGAAAPIRAYPQAPAIEVTGAAVALAGVAVAGHPSIAFTVLAAILGGAALRPDRRPLGWAAAASLQLAGWIWLAGHGVGTPEAYALPLAAVLLALGASRRQHDVTLSSWTAYGPGLAVALLPSLLAAVGGTGTVRPLLLGGTALALLLAAARTRLQAPLTLAAATLALLAIDQLGPAFAEITAELPRWLAPALAGALLLVLGSTYERRLRDLRRATTAFSRLA